MKKQIEVVIVDGKVYLHQEGKSELGDKLWSACMKSRKATERLRKDTEKLNKSIEELKKQLDYGLLKAEKTINDLIK